MTTPQQQNDKDDTAPLSDAEITKMIEHLGLSEKGAQTYLANLELGESTIDQLSNHSGIKRTSMYHVVDELQEKGAIVQTKRNKKVYYIAAKPAHLLTLMRRKMDRFEDALEQLTVQQHKVGNKPRVYFLYGPQGFKQIWDMVLQPETKEYCMVTDAFSFEDYVSPKYLQEEIIEKKKKLKISSRQMLSLSPRANEIISKDSSEKRQTKIFPFGDSMDFTELITKDFVAFISQRIDNFLFVIESASFAKSRQTYFDAVWNEIQK